MADKSEINVEFKNNAPDVLQALKEACLRALERIGLQAEGYAIDLVPVDTGNLKNSLTHSVDEDELSVTIGTPNDFSSRISLNPRFSFSASTTTTIKE